MNRRIAAAIGAAMSVIAISAAFLFTTISASAQPIVWVPPCANPTKVHNATTCAATLRLRTIGGAVAPVNVPPGASVPLNIPAGTQIFGVITQANNTVPLVTPGPVMPPPAPAVAAAAWASGVTMPPAGCCFDVYFDTSTAPSCVIWLMPGTAPCTP